MTNQFPGSFPVISDDGATLFGYVFQAPTDPDTATHTHWTYATTIGYVSPFRHVSRRAAVLALLASCNVTRPDLLAVADLDLMGVLHGLTERYTGREILRAALNYAVATTAPVPVEETGPDAAARRGDPAPIDRTLMHKVLTGQIGPFTADDVFALYDKVAPDRVPLVAVLPD